MYFVYFKQHLVAVHSKLWSKSAISRLFFSKNAEKGRKNRKLKQNLAKTCFLSLPLNTEQGFFFSFVTWKTLKKQISKQHLECAAPKCCLKYTTDVQVVSSYPDFVAPAQMKGVFSFPMIPKKCWISSWESKEIILIPLRWQ